VGGLMKNKKYFIDSYGRQNSFCGDIEVLSNLRKREVNNVISEVMELLSRIYKRSSGDYAYTVAEFISIELNVRLSTVLKIFNELQKRGLVIKNTDDKPKPKSLVQAEWSKNTYKITGKFKEYTN
jgi:hypothetical protein